MHKLNLILIFSTLFLSCSSNKNEKQAQEVMLSADSTFNNSVSSSAAVQNNKDTVRKFIRTADLKFKVKSVINTTYNIEAITLKQGGFVTNTNLTSNVDEVENVAISSDSTLETTNYTVTNTITLRVPNTKLDTALKEIAKNIDFLDYRIIKADDVALQIVANNLTQNRSVKIGKRITNAIDKRGKKLNETTTAEELLLNKQEQSDNAQVANLNLKDQINFSTINLLIYQRQTTKRELVLNDKNVDFFQPSFAKRIFESLKFGWYMLEELLVSLTKLWAILLFIVLMYFIYRKYKNRLK